MTPHPVEITAPDGCVLRGQVWPGGSSWVVLLHDVGENEDLDRWRSLLPALLAEQLSVLAVDLRGHGASDGDWMADASADDISTVIRSVRERSAETIFIVVAGRNAVDALLAAERESVNGVVALSANGSLDRVHGTTVGADRCVRPSDRRECGQGGHTGPPLPTPTFPRAPGIPKLFLVGAEDAESRQTTASLHAASIGWALVVTLPTAGHGTDLLMGSTAAHVREQIVGFIRECRFLARSVTKGTAPSPETAEAFLRRLGITVKGAET